MDEELIRQQLEYCLCTPTEIELHKSKSFPTEDEWPINSI